MPFSAALSRAPQTSRALDDVTTEAQRQLTANPDLAVVYFSPHHAGEADAIASRIMNGLKPRGLSGCTGKSIAANEQEIEWKPALSLWLAGWSRKVDLEPFHLTLEHTSDGHSLLGWPDSMVGANLAESALLLLGDPFTFPV